MIENDRFETRRLLYDNGASDKMVAEAQDITLVGAREWRRKHLYNIDYSERRWLYSSLSLEDRIICSIYGSPKYTDELSRDINSNSPPENRVKEKFIFKKLKEMENEDKVYNQRKVRRNGSIGIGFDNFKWFLRSDYIVKMAVEDELGVSLGDIR
jgi:hypothetical protein